MLRNMLTFASSIRMIFACYQFAHFSSHASFPPMCPGDVGLARTPKPGGSALRSLGSEAVFSHPRVLTKGIVEEGRLSPWIITT